MINRRYFLSQSIAVCAGAVLTPITALAAKQEFTTTTTTSHTTTTVTTNSGYWCGCALGYELGGFHIVKPGDCHPWHWTLEESLDCEQWSKDHGGTFVDAGCSLDYSQGLRAAIGRKHLT